MTSHEAVQQVIRMKQSAPLTLDRQRSALIIVDVQRYFTEPGHAFTQMFERMVPGLTREYLDTVRTTVLPNVAKLVGCFRERNLPVFYTATGCQTGDGRELPKWLRDFDRAGQQVLGKRIWPDASDPSYAVDPAVAPRAGEFVVHKTSSGPLNSTKLDQTLHNLGVTGLVVCGLTTDVCVSQTARETADRGFDVVIAEDACATLSPELHRAALEIFALAFGRTATTDAVARHLEAAAAHVA